MKDIFDHIDDYYRYPTKPKLVEAIEGRIYFYISQTYRQHKEIPNAVTLDSGEYKAVKEFADKVTEWSRRTGTGDPLGPWKTIIGLETPWGFVEIREDKNDKRRKD